MTDLRYEPTKRIVAYIPHPVLSETCVIDASTGRLPAFSEVNGLSREQVLGKQVRHITGSAGSVDFATGSEFGTLFAVKAPRISVIRKGYAWLNHCLRDIMAEQEALASNPDITARTEDLKRALEPNLEAIAVGALAHSLKTPRDREGVFSYMFDEQASLLKNDPPKESFY